MNLSRTSLLLLVIYPASLTALWWSLDLSRRLDRNNICKRTQAFLKVRGKSDFCRSNPELIKKVLGGVDRAVEECQFQFHYRKWNCSTNRNSIRKIVRQDYRETAFIFAITSAGISYHVTRSCNMGELRSCGCSRRVQSQNSVTDPGADSSPQENWRNTEFEWRGCKKNLKYGSDVSAEFMDVAKSRRDPRALIIRHNNKAGVLAVETNIQKECKCHGISGQCSQKTCWQKLPTFRKVSSFLKSKFDGASQVMISNKGSELLVEGTIKPPTEFDLVYTTDSPDFCSYDPRTGSLGTQGRLCNASSKAVDGCAHLCCHRKPNTDKVIEKYNCKCRFFWCCRVDCETCIRERTIHKCPQS